MFIQFFQAKKNYIEFRLPLCTKPSTPCKVYFYYGLIHNKCKDGEGIF